MWQRIIPNATAVSLIARGGHGDRGWQIVFYNWSPSVWT